MKTVYQWILQDKQETAFPKFILTYGHYATKNELLSCFPSLGECFVIIKRYNPSAVSQDWLINKITVRNSDINRV